jgi:hypothetical protein
MPLRVQVAEKMISNLVAELYPIAHVTLAISTRSRDARTAPMPMQTETRSPLTTD